MLTSVLIFLLLHLGGKEGAAMLVRLYAGEIILGKITLADVPVKLRQKVADYLAEMGYTEE